MNNFMLDLLKISAGTTIIYLTYILLFSRDTFYLRNRILLIATLILPTFIPFIKFPITVYREVPLSPVNIPDNILSDISVTIPSNPFDYAKICEWIYIFVAGFLFLRVVFSVLSTCNIIKKGTLKRNQFPKIVITDSQLPPFSFFPYAVIPANDYNNGNIGDILKHEFAHIRQGHTFDLLLSELFISFQWFNPIVWLIKRSVILNHEYLADHVSLLNIKSSRDYQYRLLSISGELKHISLAHNFNSLIKNRIIMINKKPTHRYATLKNLIILPVAAIVVYAFATPDYHYVSPLKTPLIIYQTPGIIQKEATGIILKEDGTPLEGVIISSTGTAGNAIQTLSDKSGKFSILNLQPEASLIFMRRGYKQLILKPDYSSLMTVTMVKDPDFKTLSSNDSISEEEPYVVVEMMPMYPGGESELLRFIQDNINYPEEAKVNRIEGKVIVRFVVSPDGSAKDISILKGINPQLNAEAVRVCSLIKGFVPGSQGGKPVPVYYMVPVTFSLTAPQQPNETPR